MKEVQNRLKNLKVQHVIYCCVIKLAQSRFIWPIGNIFQLYGFFYQIIQHAYELLLA